MSNKSRYPLKRVRNDQENQKTFFSSDQQKTKKFRRQSSETLIQKEKSSDERAFQLFQNEYFPQIRPYFNHQCIAQQLIKHLWTNLNESSKVYLVKKFLKDPNLLHLSTIHLNTNEIFSNDENNYENSQLSMINLINDNYTKLPLNNQYNRSFLNDFISFLKHFLTPRFIDPNVPIKSHVPLRRSSRVRRAPMKCVCSTCVTTRNFHEEISSSTSIDYDNPHQKMFRELIDYYLKLDDDYIDLTENSSMDNSQIESTLSEIVESIEDVSSFDCSSILNEKNPIINSDTFLSDQIERRTFVILAELDEPFFGPYPIEFTITI